MDPLLTLCETQQLQPDVIWLACHIKVRHCSGFSPCNDDAYVTLATSLLRHDATASAPMETFRILEDLQFSVVTPTPHAFFFESATVAVDRLVRLAVVNNVHCSACSLAAVVSRLAHVPLRSPEIRVDAELYDRMRKIVESDCS